MKRLLLLFLFLLAPCLIHALNVGKVAGKINDAQGNPLIETSLVESGTLKGKVVEAKTGEPIIGASVIIVGTTTGTVAEINGAYSLNFNPGSYTIRVSSVGFQTEEFKDVVIVADRETIMNFRLTETVITGQEVVIIGYGVQKKREVTGAVTSVNMRALEKLPATNVNSALQGMVAGVNVSAGGADPGSSPNIYVRGVGTLNNNTPLYIVDGVPTSTLYYLNPSDIESMDVLKDASAAAIYGSRAANGVINITTKRGKKGGSGNLKMTLNMYYGSESFSNYIPVVTNSSDYIKLVKIAAAAAGRPNPTFVSQYEATPSAYPNTDWQNEFFHTVANRKFDFAVAGGSENWNFAISAMYGKQDGVIIGTSNESKSLRINSDIQLNPKLKVGESFSIGRRGGRWLNFENSISYELFRMPPTIPVYDPTNPEGWGNPNTGIGYARIHNPIAEANLTDPKNDYIEISASGYAEYKILDNLTYKFQLSQQIRDGYDYSFTPSFYVASTWQRTSAALSETRSRGIHNVFDNTLTYDIKLNLHEINLMTGYSEEKTDYRNSWAYAEGFPSNDLRVLDAGTTNKNVGGYETSSRLRSFFGRLLYSYDDTYLLTFNVRRDGSSRFSPDNQYGTFPSFSVGWRLSKESFLKNFFESVEINDLKLRASYGVLGNQEIGDYGFFPVVATDGYMINYPLGIGVTSPINVGATPNIIPSYNIKWEETKSTNIGLDFAMFNDRLTLAIDYYLKKTSGILYGFRYPISSGAPNNPIVNAGEMQNNGIEFSATYRNFDNPFKYQVITNVTTYNNEVLQLGSNQQEIIKTGAIHWSVSSPITWTRVGESIASFYLYQSAGLFKSDEEAANYKNANGVRLQSKAKAGDVKFVDVNSDGVLNDNDKVNKGSAIPDVEYSLNLSASYMDFDINVFFVGVAGKKLYNGNKVLTYLAAEYGNFSTDYLNAWSPSNPNSDMQRLVLSDPNQNNRPSDRFLENASYLRLKHIEIGYTLPLDLVNNFGISKLRVYLSAENLFTITSYTGYDPAIDGSNSIYSRGVDINSYPYARNLLFGIQVGF